MAQRLIFRVLTPLGDWVSLTRDRWRQITRFKHRAVTGHESAVRTCVQSPLLVRASTKDASVHLYYIAAGGAYLCVVTAPTGPTQRFVVTAYFTKNIKPGTELWKK
jgi:hypothetical protein